jgi:glutamate/aspartate transport system substrate-binding protein
MASTMKRNALLGLAVLAVACDISMAQAASPTLDKIKETGKLSLGYREASVPFAFLDNDQKPVGLSMDLCAAIAAKIKTTLNLPKLEISYVPVNASNRIPTLQSGTIDIECGSTTNTADRQKQVAFTVATFVTSPRWIVMASSGITDVKGLKDKIVVFTQGTSNFPIGKKVIDDGKLNSPIAQGKDQGESLLMLQTGRAFGWFEDDILEAGLVANTKDPKEFRFLPETYELSYYGLMLPRDDTEFKALADGTIKALMASGEFTKMYDKWFTSPIPPRGQNLSRPMSEAMKARVASPSDSLTP